MPLSPLRRAGAAVAAVGATALLSSPAAAQSTITLPSPVVVNCYPPRPDCVTTTSSPGPAVPLTLDLSAIRVVRGQTIAATARGFRAGTSGIFSVASAEQQLATFTVSSAGTATGNITIPANISLGAHTVFARGTASNGTPGSASRAITVVSSGGGGGGGGTLSRTGAVVVPTALVGLALVAGGAALKRSSRRGKSSSSV